MTAQQITTAVAAITANSQNTEEITVFGKASLSITGTFVGTIALQRNADGANWNTVSSYTAPAEVQFEEGARDVRYRLRSTAWTSGTGNCRIFM